MSQRKPDSAYCLMKHHFHLVVEGRREGHLRTVCGRQNFPRPSPATTDYHLLTTDLATIYCLLTTDFPGLWTVDCGP